MRPHGPRTLIWRLGLALMVAMGAVLGLAGWYVYGQLRELHFQQTLDKLESMTAVLAGSYSDLLDADPGELRRRVEADGHRAHFRITIIPDAEHVLADSTADATTMDDHRHRPEVVQAFDTGTGIQTRFSNTVGEQMMYYARRIESPAGDPVVIRTAVPLTRINADLSQLRQRVILLCLTVLSLIFVAVYFTSRHARMRLQTVTDGARRFASGDLSHRISPLATQDLNALADALNKMAAQLQARIDQLQTKRNEQQAILRAMTNAVIALDPDQHIVDMNRAAADLLGVKADNARGRLIQEVARQPELHQFISRAISDPGFDSQEMNLTGDPPRTAIAESTPLTNAADERTGLLVVLNDVTQLRRLESMRSDFAANVSHELRTPITSIKGYVETLLDVGVDDHEQTRKFLTTIKTNSDRLAAIVEDVMALTKLEEPEFRESLERDPTQLAAIADAVIAQFRPTSLSKRISLVNKVESNVIADVHRHMIEQALGNLVANAIAYSPENTTVTIDSSIEPEGMIDLAVTDQGPGIAPEHHDRLFERFYRADKARSRQLGGTGLGLAIVKHIAQVHGGDVGLDSLPGRGSTFHIYLPAS